MKIFSESDTRYINAHIDAERLTNQGLIRLEARSKALAARSEREAARAPLVVLTPQERDRAVLERNPKPARPFDPTKLKMKKEKKSSGPTTKQWTNEGKTARDKGKVRDDSRKTNNPKISQEMKGRVGQKPSK